tara:strand:+ start:391 stop:582 length:192 start_codon:yes stop_codon:yes gene_type:complete
MTKFISFFAILWIVICGFLIILIEVNKKEMYFNCANLIGGWHPDIPQKFKELCDEAKKERNER